jgi:hypothetical protein
MFADFRKSSVGKEVYHHLARKQCYMCPITMTSLCMSTNTHLSHIIPIKLLEKMGRYDLVIDEKNLFLEEGSSNKSRKDNIVTELIEDLLNEGNFSEEEIILIKDYLN